MTTNPSIDSVRQATIATPRSDAIRVVPLKLPPAMMRRPAGIGAPPSPQLTYRGGPLLGQCDVVTLFWGAQWNTATNKTLRSKVGAFFQYVMTSLLIDQLAEYSVSSQMISHGTFNGSFVVASSSPAMTVSDATVRHFLNDQLASNAQLPKPTPNRLYFIYLPPGTAVVQGGGKSCTVFCGYHDAITDPVHGEIYYSPVPYPGCSGCRGGLTVLDALTSTSSHELCEAITDAVPGQGWYDDHYGEIGDICAWKTRKLGGYTVQLEWSNAAGKCV
jgi:hypothetical protein